MVDVPGRNWVVVDLERTGGTGIPDQRTSESKISSRSNSGIDTHMGHHPGYNQMIDTAGFQILKQIGIPKAVRIMFYDDFLVR